MPLCCLCRTSFNSAGWSAPAEPCDCGECLTWASVEEMLASDFRDAAERSRRAINPDYLYDPESRAENRPEAEVDEDPDYYAPDETDDVPSEAAWPDRPREQLE